MPIKSVPICPRRRINRQQGFSLIEVLVTVTIVALLASIAYPSYQRHVIRSNQSLAQQFMLDIANREEDYLLNNRQYGTLQDLGVGTPNRLAAFYIITAAPQNSAAPYGYMITATPVAGTPEASDGPLTLDHLGNRTPATKW